MISRSEVRFDIPGLKYLRHDQQLRPFIDIIPTKTAASTIGQRLFVLFILRPELFSILIDSPFINRSRVSTTLKFLQEAQKDGAIQRSFELSQSGNIFKNRLAKEAFPHNAGYLSLYAFGILNMDEIAKKEGISNQAVNDKLNRVLKRIYRNASGSVTSKFKEPELRKSPSASISAQRLLKLSIVSELIANLNMAEVRNRAGLRKKFIDLYGINLTEADIKLIIESNLMPKHPHWQEILSLKNKPNGEVIKQITVGDYQKAMKLEEPPIIPLTKIPQFIKQLHNITIGAKKVSYVIDFLSQYNVPIGKIIKRRRIEEKQRYVFIARSSACRIEEIFEDKTILDSFLKGLKKRR